MHPWWWLTFSLPGVFFLPFFRPPPHLCSRWVKINYQKFIDSASKYIFRSYDGARFAVSMFLIYMYDTQVYLYLYLYFVFCICMIHTGARRRDGVQSQPDRGGWGAAKTGQNTKQTWESEWILRWKCVRWILRWLKRYWWYFQGGKEARGAGRRCHLLQLHSLQQTGVFLFHPQFESVPYTSTKPHFSQHVLCVQ